VFNFAILRCVPNESSFAFHVHVTHRYCIRESIFETMKFDPYEFIEIGLVFSEVDNSARQKRPPHFEFTL